MPQNNDTAEWPWREATRRADTLERVAPSRAPSVEADVNVPLMQSIASGIFGAAAGGTLACVVWRDPIAGAIGTCAGFLLVAGVVWAVLLADHRALLWAIERATRADLDGNGQTRTQELRVAISHYDQNGRFVRMEYLNIPGITQAQLTQFAREVCSGMPLSVATWTGRGALFTRAQYDTLMAHLVRGGLIVDGGKQGREMTRAGWHVLRRIAGLPQAPYPATHAGAESLER